jgi:hypothetical protein
MMDDGIEIKISKQGLERFLYITIIVALLIVTAFLLFRNCECVEEVVQETPTGMAAGSNESEEDEEAVVEEAEVEEEVEELPTCDDRKKNGDETDVDCGGSECSACDEGDRCILNADCDKGSCKSGLCDASKDVSGIFSLKIEDVETSGDSETAAVVEEIVVSMENGLEESINVRLDIYLLSSNRKNYLNQLIMDDENIRTYAEVTVGAMTSGWINNNQPYNLRDIDAFTGTKFVTSPGVYEPGDDFIVEIEAYDTRTGDKLDTVSVKVNG